MRQTRSTQREGIGVRRLRVEWLEQRRLLSVFGPKPYDPPYRPYDSEYPVGPDYPSDVLGPLVCQPATTSGAKFSNAEFFTGGAAVLAGSGKVAKGVEPLAAAIDGYTTIFDAGPSSNRVDIVFVGDGYTAGEIDTTYVEHVEATLAHMFDGQEDPFPRYKNFFNVHRVDVVSAQSGADSPPDGIYRNTALDASYYWDGVSSQLLYVSTNKTYSAYMTGLSEAEFYPEMKLVAVNDSRYGGGGGYFAVYAAAHASAAEIAVHESGHSFNGLADEYETGGPTYYTGMEPMAANATTSPVGEKWAPWLGYTDPDYPDMSAVGAFEGAGGSRYDIYRPTENSKMRELFEPHHAVSRETIIRDIYSFVNPLDGWRSNLNLIDENDPLLWVEVVDPDVIEVEWFVDGELVEGASGESFRLADFGIGAGTHEVIARAFDPTDWVRSGLGELEQSITWSVEIALSTIEGVAWDDIGQYGIQDPGEGGVPDVTVHLLDDSLAIVDTVTTLADGTYEFRDLPDGVFALQFVAPFGALFSPRDVGQDDTIDSDVDPDTGQTSPFVVGGGRELRFDAGLTSIRVDGVAWEDFDGNGIHDPGEIGMAGVSVTLLDSDFTEIATTATDSQGAYRFVGLSPGWYSLYFLAPEDVAFSPADSGNDDSVDSDVDLATGRTELFALMLGKSTTSHDAGMFRLVSIGGVAWDDSNSLGIQNPLNPAVPNLTVRLLDHDLVPLATTTTEADGSYLFEDILYGEYSVEFVLPRGTVFALQDQGGDDSIDSDVDPATGRTLPIAPRSGQDVFDVDAGIRGTFSSARAGDRVWNDLDGDGVQDPNETGVGGVSVELLDAGLATLATMLTDAGGRYEFSGLPPGWYSLRFSAPDGTTLGVMHRGEDDLFDSDVNRSTGRTAPFYLVTGQGDYSRDVALYPHKGVTLVGDTLPGSESGSPENLTASGDLLFFTAADQDSGRELWRTDGTPSGTLLVKDLWAGGSSSAPEELTELDGSVFFRATDPVYGDELFKSDGTPGGTVLVEDIYAGSADASPGELTVSAGTLFFGANDGTSGEELWKTDGTSAGTLLVKDILPGGGGSNLENFTDVGGTLFFTARDGEHGTELWKTDGTAEGTVMVRDIKLGSYNSSPEHLTNVGGTLFFTVYDPLGSIELYRSDGTEQGTVVVKDFGSGGSSVVGQLTAVGNSLFLTVDDAVYGRELFKSDGTEQGTVLVNDINQGSQDSSPRLLTDVGGTLFFVATDADSGDELWKSDGTPAGTVQVRDIRPGEQGSAIGELTFVDGALFFAADDGIHGTELWKSDGSALGTVMVRDIRTGPQEAEPEHLTPVGTTLFFTAENGFNGEEIWRSDGSLAFSTDVPAGLRITEIMAHANAGTDAEFIELKNVGTEPIDLTGTRFTLGVAFDFGSSEVASLFPGEYLVVVASVYDFSLLYDADAINIAGEYGGQLEEDGERIELAATYDEVVAAFSYDAGWFALTEQLDAYSLTIVDDSADPATWDDESAWRPGSFRGGSPGADDPGSTPDPGAVVINEIMAHPADGNSDWIELYNATGQDIDIGGWHLAAGGSGAQAFFDYQIETNTMIPAAAYLVLSKDIHFDFDLSDTGDSLQLTAGIPGSLELLGYSESVQFGGTDEDVTLGRYGPHFVALSQPTPGDANTTPQVGPVVFNEVMYRPAFQHHEFIELLNISPQSVDIGGWRVEGIGDFELPENVVLPVKGSALLVPIDPESFRQQYNIPQQVPIIGPYPESLDDEADALLLFKRDALGRETLLDELQYQNLAPWPEEADLGGASLERIGPREYGNDPTNWDVTQTFGGTPGAYNTVANAAVVNRFVFYNNSAFDTAQGATDDDAIAPDKTALLPEQTLSFANYTNYVRGLNGILIDVDNSAALLSVEDFQFKVGNDGNPAGWQTLADQPQIIVRPGAGADDSDRVAIIFDDYLIRNQWLQVTVLANQNTALSAADVFYFGNAVADVGNSQTDAITDQVDVDETRDNLHPFYDPASIDVPHDFNRDRRVDTADILIARTHQNTAETALQLRFENPAVVITEANPGTPDYIEIQNVSSTAIDTTGWVVAANNAQSNNINAVHAVLWELPDSLAPGEILLRVDSAGDDIFWRASGVGWVMIVDAQGSVVDFVVWGYSPEDLAAFGVDVGSFQDLTIEDAWIGPAVANDGSNPPGSSLQRIGNADHHDVTDWLFVVPSSPEVQNQGLSIPFVSTGGFEDGGFEGGGFENTALLDAVFAQTGDGVALDEWAWLYEYDYHQPLDDITNPKDPLDELLGL